jgi:hypothetical protein
MAVLCLLFLERKKELNIEVYIFSTRFVSITRSSVLAQLSCIFDEKSTLLLPCSQSLLVVLIILFPAFS